MDSVTATNVDHTEGDQSLPGILHFHFTHAKTLRNRGESVQPGIFLHHISVSTCRVAKTCPATINIRMKLSIPHIKSGRKDRNVSFNNMLSYMMLVMW